jgi:beta-glucanase (GH16 family)
LGYLVSGAGDATFNGCYTLEKAKCFGRDCFAKDKNHNMYTYAGEPWHLGGNGTFSYAAINPTAWPPESTGGCGTVWAVGEVKRPPCPAIKRSNLGPLPPPPPPLPPPPPPPPAPPTPAMRLVWEDHFEGDRLNASLWNVLEQVHRGGVYTKENVRVEQGMLILDTIAQNLTIRQGSDDVPFYVTSGAVNTSGLFEQKRGRFEVSVKLPMVAQSPGYTLHSAFWLKTELSVKSNTGCPFEIDVFEQYTATAGAVSSAAAALHPFNHTTTGRCNQTPGAIHVPANGGGSKARGDWSSNFTLFTVDWTESWVAMYVDGEVYANFNTHPEAVELFSDPLFVTLTSCVMERTPTIAADVLPQQFATTSRFTRGLMTTTTQLEGERNFCTRVHCSTYTLK